MFILQDPQRARSLGLLGAKAQLAGGTADWPGYFALLAQTTAVGGTVIFGVILIWIFGREFSDHTAKDLLALPTSRAAIVIAKFAVTGLWCGLLAVEAYLLGLGDRRCVAAAWLVGLYRMAGPGSAAGHRGHGLASRLRPRVGRQRRPGIPRRGRGHVRDGVPRADHRDARLRTSVPVVGSGRVQRYRRSGPTSRRSPSASCSSWQSASPASPVPPPGGRKPIRAADAAIQGRRPP